MHDVLLIPGIGGHPLFHRRLIDGLHGQFRIHTSPHGDFFGCPYAVLEAHINFWRERADAIDTCELGVIAVSFGAHILPQLIARSHQRFSRLVLVSPWIPNNTGRIGLQALRMAPARLVAPIIAAQLMRWTDRRTEDAREIAKYRAELYDDPHSVAKRWHLRLLAIGDCAALTWESLGDLSRSHSLTVLLGRHEWLWRLQRRQLLTSEQRFSGVTVRTLSGGHDVGTFSTPEVIEAVAEALV